MSEPKPLYVKRDVENASDIIAHFKAQGYQTLTKPEDMHVTQTYSREPVVWEDMGEDLYGGKDGKLIIPENDGPRTMAQFDGGAVVMKFHSTALTVRHNQMRREGASWDYDSYNPHITITREGGDVDLNSVVPWTGPIVLGPEIFEALDTEWSKDREEAAENVN